MLSYVTSKGVVMASDLENFIMKVNLNTVLLGLKQVQRQAVHLRLYRFSPKGVNRRQNHGYVIMNKNLIQFQLFKNKTLMKLCIFH